MEYRIGDFSLLTRLPVKTLHFYHQEGLLLPSRVDSVTGYRWYGEGEIHLAGLITLLKSAGFTLAEIREILGECRDDTDLAGFLERKMQQVDQKIREFQRARAGLGKLRESLDPEPPSPAGVEPGLVSLVTRPELSYISIRYTGAYGDVGSRFGSLFRLAKGAASGPPFCLYHQAEYREEDADIEACVPVSRQVPGTEPRILPARSWLETIHTGAYADMGKAYGRLFREAASRGLGYAPPARECYLKGPGHFFPGRPEHYRTLVAVPLV